MGMNLTTAQVEEMITGIDSNQDGKISFDEFKVSTASNLFALLFFHSVHILLTFIAAFMHVKVMMERKDRDVTSSDFETCCFLAPYYYLLGYNIRGVCCFNYPPRKDELMVGNPPLLLDSLKPISLISYTSMQHPRYLFPSARTFLLISFIYF